MTTARAASLAALVTAVCHLPLAAGHLHDGTAAALVLLVLAAGCLHCARALWAAPTRRSWATALVMAVGMVAVHAPGSPLAHAHGHGGAQAALALVAGTAELLLLGLAATALLSSRRPQAGAWSPDLPRAPRGSRAAASWPT